MNNGKIKLSKIEMGIDKILRALRDDDSKKSIMKKWRKIKHTYHKYQLSNRNPMINLFFSMSLSNQIGMFVNHVVAMRDDPEYNLHLTNACVKIEGYLEIVNDFTEIFGEKKIDYSVFNMGHTTLAMLVSEEVKKYNEEYNKKLESRDGKEYTLEEKTEMLKVHIDKVDEIFLSWIETLKKGIPEFVTTYSYLYEKKETEEDKLFEDLENDSSILSEMLEATDDSTSITSEPPNMEFSNV